MTTKRKTAPKRRRGFTIDFDAIEKQLLNVDAIGNQVAKHLLDNPLLRDRVEKVAAARIDKTICDIIEAKAKAVVTKSIRKPIPSGYGGSFVFSEFVRAKIAEWAGSGGTIRISAVVDQMIQEEMLETIKHTRGRVRQEVGAAVARLIAKFSVAFETAVLTTVTPKKPKRRRA